MSPRARKILVTIAALAAVGSWAAATLLAGPPTLESLHVRHPPNQPGDWLAEHPEQHESFATYVQSGPVRATAERRTIYVQPIGEFSADQVRVLERTADGIARFFQVPVVTRPTLPSSTIPAEARRGNQLLTTHILEQVLTPSLPADALSMIALTSEDLYPGADWNFVFGEASPVDRVGVWSMFRNGQPGTPLYLERTLKTAVHELGHMLSMPHCVAWSCVMNGSNSLPEADRQPSSLCPVCLKKLTWNVGLDPVKRFEELGAFYADAGFAQTAAFTARELAAVKSERR